MLSMSFLLHPWGYFILIDPNRLPFRLLEVIFKLISIFFPVWSNSTKIKTQGFWWNCLFWCPFVVEWNTLEIQSSTVWLFQERFHFWPPLKFFKNAHMYRKPQGDHNKTRFFVFVNCKHTFFKPIEVSVCLHCILLYQFCGNDGTTPCSASTW